jgi:hypothetical protein
MGFLATYGSGPDHLGNLTWSFGQEVHFKYRYINFPVPIDGVSTLPGGSTDFRIDGQYWTNLGIFTFQTYLMTVYSPFSPNETQFNTEVALFQSLYPNIFIKPYSAGQPYKAYKRLNTDTVVSSLKNVMIKKIDNSHFNFRIFGYLLIVTPSITETDFSDPTFPTYKPLSDPIQLQIKAYMRGHPVNFSQSRTYQQ